MSVASLAAAQRRLLDRHGVCARSYHVAAAGPVRGVHVLEAGHGRPVLRAWRRRVLGAVGAAAGGDAGRPSPDRRRPSRLRPHRPLLLRRRPAGPARTPRVDRRQLDGALWSLWLAAARPDRVERLVLVGAPALLLDSHGPLRMRLLAHPLLGPILRRRGSGATPRDAVRAIYEELGDPIAATDPAYVAAVVAHWARPGDDEAFWPLVRRVMNLRGQRGISFGADELRRLELPVRLVWGRRDNFAGVSVGERAARLLPHGELHVVDGGHPHG